MSADGSSVAQGAESRPVMPDGRTVPGPQQMQQIMAQKRMAQQQAQVDEVVGIMRTNVEKVLERDQKLTALDERADALQDGASQFEKQAGKLKNKFWLQNMKWLIAGALLLLVIVILIYLNHNEDKMVREMEDHQKTSQGSPESVPGDTTEKFKNTLNHTETTLNTTEAKQPEGHE